MKLRNKILAMAVVAVAGVNVYLANDVNARNNALSLLNLENIADATDCIPGTIETGKWNGVEKTKCCEFDDRYYCAAMVYTEGGGPSGAGHISGHATDVN